MDKKTLNNIFNKPAVHMTIEQTDVFLDDLFTKPRKMTKEFWLKQKEKDRDMLDKHHFEINIDWRDDVLDEYYRKNHGV